MLKIIVWPTLAKQITKGTKLMFSDRQRYNKPPVNASTTPILIPFCNEVIFKAIPANIKYCLENTSDKKLACKS
jgi:hypothetical protein